MNNDLEAEKKRAYSKGYHAGRKRKQVAIDADRAHRERVAFRDRAFLAALTAVISTNWNMKDSDITVESKVKAAWAFANEASRQRKS